MIMWINVNEISTIEDFQKLKKWDIVVCKFKSNIDHYKWDLVTFKVQQNKYISKEIILDKKHNTYINYDMYIRWESIVSSILLIT